MNWLEKGNWTKIAKNALATAQTKFDQVLDIHEDIDPNTDVSVNNPSTSGVETDSFFSSFFEQPASDNVTQSAQFTVTQEIFERAEEMERAVHESSTNSKVESPHSQAPTSENGSSESESIEVLSMISTERTGDLVPCELVVPPPVRLSNLAVHSDSSDEPFDHSTPNNNSQPSTRDQDGETSSNTSQTPNNSWILLRTSPADEQNASPTISSQQNNEQLNSTELRPDLLDLQITPDLVAPAELSHNRSIDNDNQQGDSQPLQALDVIADHQHNSNSSNSPIADIVRQELDVIPHSEQDVMTTEEIPLNENVDPTSHLSTQELNNEQGSSLDVVRQELDILQPSDNALGGVSFDLIPAVEPSDAVPTYQSMVIMDRGQTSIISSSTSAILVDVSVQTTSDETAIIDELLAKCRSLQEVVSTREDQLMSLTRRTTDSQEENEELKSKLIINSESYQEKIDDLHFQLSSANSKIESLLMEKSSLQKQIESISNDSVRLSDLVATINEKDEMIVELKNEGEALAQEQHKSSTHIKKLKAKEKEAAAEIKKITSKYESKISECDNIRSKLSLAETELSESEKRVAYLNDLSSKHEKELSSIRAKHAQDTDRNLALENNLESAYKELAELKKAFVSQENLLSETATSSELQTQEEIKKVTESIKREFEIERQALLDQIHERQLDLNRQQYNARRGESLLNEEIVRLQQRLEENESRNQDLANSVAQATQPLLRQISSLQAQQASQAESWNQLEQSFIGRINEARGKCSEAVERERMASEKLLDLSQSNSEFEAALSLQKTENGRLSKDLSEKQSQCSNLLQELSSMRSELSECRKQQKKAEGLLETEVAVLKGQLEHSQLQLEGERTKVFTLEETIRELNDRNHSNSPRLSSSFSMSSDSPTEDVKRNFHSWDWLQAKLKQKEGEINSLHNKVDQLEKSKSNLTEQLVTLTKTNAVLKEENIQVSQLREDFLDVSKRHETLLTMYGEKAEQLDELRNDLTDMKEIYKAQIEELVKKL